MPDLRDVPCITSTMLAPDHPPTPPSPASPDPHLGVPDRSASASAPPDLEISSRSLFAFKADYSGIFSDIRMDEHYAEFYNDNPDRIKLPPPLQSPPPPQPAPQPRRAPLTRNDSAASFEDLIFRESHILRPHFPPDQPPFPSPENPLPPDPHPPPQKLPHQPPAQYLRKLPPDPDPRPTKPPISADNPSDTPALQPEPRQPTSHHLHDQQTALWKLRHLSLDTSDPPVPPTSYPYQPESRSQFPPHRAYPFHQPTSSTQAQSAAAVAAAVAAAAAQHSSSAPFSPLVPHRRPVSSPEWSHLPNPDVVRKPPALYDPPDPALSLASFASPNGPIADIFGGLQNVDDPIGAFEAASHAIAGIPYPNIPPYRDNANPTYPPARSTYQPHHQGNSISGRHANSRGRGSLAHRMDASNQAYGYNPYPNGSGSARPAGYVAARGRAIPVTPEYLNAQAAAAAAAAAAAVYQSNGVHLNGSAAFSPLRSSPGPAPSHVRGIALRGSGRGADTRRGSGTTHQDGYGRASVPPLTRNVSASVSHDRGLLDRNSSGSDAAGSGSGLKFSSFNDVVGRAEELARDQHGCRFLQTKLEEGNVVYINSIFEECYEKFVDLMTDPFGNYLCQKLFEFCNDAQRLALVERCAPAIPHVSTNMHGTRAVQRMVECLSTPEQVQAVCNALRPAAVSLMKDINGNHVIQRCLNRMEPTHNQFVYDAVAANCFELATHRHGCCVMQRCMDFASPMQRNQLAQQINANALPLVQNAFGNYVVQYVLELNDPVYTEEIIRRLRGHLAELSMQKFSSNVVEKSLQLGCRDTRRELIDELISDQDTMRRLLHDAYGNYVIQRALQIAEGPQLERICEAIRPHLNSLKQSPYGKRIQAKILKRMPKGIPPLPPTDG